MSMAMAKILRMDIGSGENWHSQKSNDFKSGVIPRYEESLEVLFMLILSLTEPHEMFLPQSGTA